MKQQADLIRSVSPIFRCSQYNSSIYAAPQQQYGKRMKISMLPKMMNSSMPKYPDHREGQVAIEIVDESIKKSNSVNNQIQLPMRENHARFLERKFSKHFMSKNSSRLLINQKLVATVKQEKSYGPKVVDERYISKIQKFSDKVMSINRQNLKKINLNENMMSMLCKSRDEIIETLREDSSKKSSSHMFAEISPLSN